MGTINITHTAFPNDTNSHTVHDDTIVATTSATTIIRNAVKVISGYLNNNTAMKTLDNSVVTVLNATDTPNTTQLFNNATNCTELLNLVNATSTPVMLNATDALHITADLVGDTLTTVSADLFNDTLNTTTFTVARAAVKAMSHEVLQRLVVPTVCVMGVVLNVLNLLVLTERCLKESPYTYLTAMAVLCLASLTMNLMHDACMHNFPHNYYCFMYTFHVYFPCVNICTNSTMWLTATLTIERFLFVKHPLWARAKCDRRAAKLKICMIIALMVLLNIPRFLQYRVVPDKARGPGYYAADHKAFRLSPAFVVISWFYSVTIQLIPMSILTVINFYLVYAVHRARRQRRRLHIRNNMEAEWSREQTRLTITLISIVFFFLLCIMPSAFSHLHVAYALFGHGHSRKEFRRSANYQLLQKVSNLLVFCQLSFNFLLYSAFNDKFLAVFKRMLRRWAERVRRRLRGQRTSSSMCRLMRLDAEAAKLSGAGLCEGEDRVVTKVQLRASNNSMSSGKDNSHTKISSLEIASE